MVRQELSLADKRQCCRSWDEYVGPGLGVGRSLSKQTQQIKGLDVRHVCEHSMCSQAVVELVLLNFPQV